MNRTISATLARASLALVRQWTRLYTMGMPSAARAARRKEIESDLWESSRAENTAPVLPLQIIARLVLGMPDDLRWRVEQVNAPARPARLAIALCVASAALLGAVWVSIASGHVDSPQPPPAPDLRWRPKNPPPPPPPPPPPF